jgi:hypothetical protein
MIMLKKNFVYKAFILSGLLMVLSCDQDSLFFKISQETLPEEALIKGGPTNIVELDNKMYVASGNTLYWYSDGHWESGNRPGGTIIGLAATSSDLYALCLSGFGVDIVLKRMNTSGVWSPDIKPDSTYPVLQTIYADSSSTRLFVGARSDSKGEYGILYVDNGSNNLQLVEDANNTGLLSGAVFDGTDHFLSTRGKGVYIVNNSTPKAVQIEGDHMFMGIIKLDTGKIVAIERNGTLFKVEKSPNKVESLQISTGKFATGALALWKGTWEGNSTQILTAGIQEQNNSSTTTSFTHGYVEFNISDGYPTSPRIDPPKITVRGNSDRYQATIGKHPINYMHQATSPVDPTMRFFASTQSGGLWSYREDRAGGWQWNAEN